MSIRVATDQELLAVYVRTIAAHGNVARGGIPGEKIAALFRAIRIAQRAAYAYSYREEIDLPEIEFPASTSPRPLPALSLKGLYEDLRDLSHNTVDQVGNQWLPSSMARLLNEIRTRTAAQGAGF